MKTTRHKPTSCPECGYTLDSASSPAGFKPKPGDLAICIECYAVSQYGDELALHAFDTALLSPADAAEIRRHVEALQRSKQHA
ncbi:MAG TPA: hypothetical protein VL131_05885 [Gammaproteobacteria bacterium]|nr:hypothetical protein [Gammaproteobacteria bacterium]